MNRNDDVEEWMKSESEMKCANFTNSFSPHKIIAAYAYAFKIINGHALLTPVC